MCERRLVGRWKMHGGCSDVAMCGSNYHSHKYTRTRASRLRRSFSSAATHAAQRAQFATVKRAPLDTAHCNTSCVSTQGPPGRARDDSALDHQGHYCCVLQNKTNV